MLSKKHAFIHSKSQVNIAKKALESLKKERDLHVMKIEDKCSSTQPISQSTTKKSANIYSKLDE